MPTVITSGAASAKGYGFGAKSDSILYVSNVFSTSLYTGTGSSKTITNGINLSGKGGLVWIKSRSATTSNFLFDTSRGATKEINSNTTDGDNTLSDSLTGFNADGFTIGSATGVGVNNETYVSWAFRKQAKFFDVVTYTGNAANRTISHNLGSAPGCIIVKRTDTTSNWQVYHRSLTSAAYSVQLNLTNGEASDSTIWNSTAPTSTEFSLGTDATVNADGGTYVVYLFAHDAGGFGVSATDNVISCSSFATNGSGSATVTVGWEPQYILIKRRSGGHWSIFDIERGFSSSSDQELKASSTAAETTFSAGYPIYPTSTGFVSDQALSASSTYIYIAIRKAA